MNELEHVNVTVADPKRTAKLLCDLFGWSVRWEGPSKDNGFSVHVGSRASYIALYAPRMPVAARPGPGALNHIGIVVDDLEDAEQRVKQAGYAPHSHADYEPGARFYFDDENGLEIEVVSYPTAAAQNHEADEMAMHSLK